MLHIYFTYTDKGPGKVVNNLLKGLDLIGEKYSLNTNKEQIQKDDKIICLQRNPIMETNKIKQMIIGPNICTLPIDNQIVLNQQYKKMLVPSLWVQNKYLKWLSKDKIHIWPVGIDTELFSDKSQHKKEIDCLVYFKRRNDNELNYVIDNLNTRGQKFKILKCGYYNETEFIDLIEKSRYSFIINGTESQGIAIQEMMGCNLPLFIWDVEFWTDRGEEHKTPATSAPYWSDECGIKETNKDLLFEKFDLFLNNISSYNSRGYILQNLTLEKQAREIVEIL